MGMSRADLLDQQWHIFARMLSNTQKKREDPYLVRANSYQFSSSIKQGWRAQLKVGAAHMQHWPASADLQSDSLDRQAPIRIAGAMGEEDDSGSHD